MTMDRTLKGASGLGKVRSVLTRAERIERMVDDGKFDLDSDNPMGLPKLKVRQSRVGGKSKKEEKEAPADGETKAEGGQARKS